MKIKKREEIELKKELKREEKKNKRRAEITRKRLKIDPAYVEKKSENSPEEVKKIFNIAISENFGLQVDFTVIFKHARRLAIGSNM